jgi:hypothetical protein
VFDQDFHSFGIPSPRSSMSFQAMTKEPERQENEAKASPAKDIRDYYESKIEEFLTENINLCQDNFKLRSQLAEVTSHLEKAEEKVKKCKNRKRELKAKIQADKIDDHGTAQENDNKIDESNSLKCKIHIQESDVVDGNGEERPDIDNMTEKLFKQIELLEIELSQMKQENKDLISIIERMESILEDKDLKANDTNKQILSKELEISELQNFLLRTNIHIESLLKLESVASLTIENLWRRTSDNLEALEVFILDMLKSKKHIEYIEDQITVYTKISNENSEKIRDLQSLIAQKDSIIATVTSKNTDLEKNAASQLLDKSCLEQNLQTSASIANISSSHLLEIAKELVDNELDPKICSSLIVFLRSLEDSMHTINGMSVDSKAIDHQFNSISFEKNMDKMMPIILSRLRSEGQINNFSNFRERESIKLVSECTKNEFNQKPFEEWTIDSSSLANIFSQTFGTIIRLAFVNNPQKLEASELSEAVDELCQCCNQLKNIETEINSLKSKREHPINFAHDIRAINSKLSYFTKELTDRELSAKKLIFKIQSLTNKFIHKMKNSTADEKKVVSRRADSKFPPEFKSPTLHHQSKDASFTSHNPLPSDMETITCSKNINDNFFIEFYKHRSDDSEIMKLLLE